MKSHRKGICLTLALIAAVIFAGCSVKLTTVRPAEISELRVERIADGVVVSLPQKAGDADIKDRLIFQLEEPYDEMGSCSETDGHLYDVSLYIMEKLDTHLTINSDGSVCRKGKRYLPSEKADSPVKVEEWDALFADATPEPSEPATAMPTEPAEVIGMDIVAAQGASKPIPAGAELQQSVPVTDILPWSYYISDVSYDGEDFIMVWRDTPTGDDAQWICSATQTKGNTALRHSIEYVEESYERSGEKYLYFTVTDAASFHRSLWCFDPETTYFNQVLDAPCSNMVLLEHEPHEAQGIGWIVHDHDLAAVDLALGSVDKGLTIDLDEYIDDSLFYGIGAFGTHKFAALSELGNYALQIDCITAEPETSAPELRTVYQLDILTHNFSQIAR